MPRISIAKQNQQFGYKLLIIALTVIIIFGAWYTYERFTKPDDGMKEAVEGIEHHEQEDQVQMIPGDDLRAHKEFLKLAAEQLMKNGYQEQAIADNYIFYNLENDTEMNLEEAKNFWNGFASTNGAILEDTIKYEVLGNGVKIIFQTENYQGEGKYFRRQLAFEGFENDQKLLLSEDLLGKSGEKEQVDTLGVGDTLPNNLELKGYYNEQVSAINLTDKFAENGQAQATAMAKGKWKLLFFYPADFTTVCPTECLALREFYSAFESLNTEVFGISTDPVSIHKAWVDYYFGPLPYPLLADTNHKLASLFDFWSEEEGVAIRGTVIVNPENKIVYISAQENNTGRSIEEYIRILTAIQTPGLKTENWHAGESTL